MAVKHLVNMMQAPGVEGINQTTLVAVTASGTSREFGEFAGADAVVFYVDCSAVSGTSPTLQLVLQEQDPTTYAFFTASDAPSFTLINGVVASQRYILDPCYGGCYQLAWTIGGTGSPSLTVSCVAQLIHRSR